jgi:phosphatidylglycerol:prolipoprotein diacylglycerol transferase
MHHWFTYPNIDPIAIHIGRFGIHWYGISYLVGFLCVYFWMSRPAALQRLGLTREQVQDFIFYAVVGVLVGGRALFVIADMLTPVSRGGHTASSYFAHPINFIAVWNGGMAFHGGLIGAIVATWFFVRKHPGLTMTRLADEICVLVPIGITLTRMVNFINDELWGRVCRPDHPFCLIFPADPTQQYRYPSQLFEGGLDLLTLPILLMLYRTRPRDGVVFWSWFTLYGITRSVAEIWRSPGILVFGVITGGQLLALPMILIGAVGIWYCATHGQAQKPNRASGARQPA